MQVSDLVNQYQTNLATGGDVSARTKGTKGVEQLVSTLSKLQKGQVFEGTVNSIKGNQVVLGLSSGQNVTARLDSGMTLKVGESVFFQVKSNEDNMIQIKPVSIGSSNNPTLLNALNAAGLAVTEDNLNMVNTMMKEQMPIDAKSIMDMARVTSSMPNTDVSTVVTMMKHQLPLTTEMINQFENYKANEGQLLKEVDTLGDAISELMSSDEVTAEEAADFQKQLLSVLSGEDEGDFTHRVFDQAENLKAMTGNETSQPVINIKDIVFKNVNTQADSLKQMVDAGAVSDGAKASEPADLSETGADLQTQSSEKSMSESAQPMENLTPETVLDADGEAGVYLPDSDRVSELLTGERVIVIEDEPSVAVSTYEKADYPGDSVGGVLTPEENATFSTALKNVTSFASAKPEFFDENGNLRPEIGDSELLRALSDYADASPENKAQLKALFSQKGYAKLISGAISQTMTIAPEELKEKGRLDDLYQKINSNTQKIASLASKLTPNPDNSVTAAAGEIHDNLDFISRVNDMYTYIQIPLQMSGQQATGDLYVYRNKKQNKGDDDEITAFLHFDLEHLGSTDISVRMKNKNVNTKFYLDDDASYELIMNNIHILKENLDNLGYTCVIDCENDSHPVDFVSDFLERDVKTAENISRYSFDVRA